jgi:hypothetical protein
VIAAQHDSNVPSVSIRSAGLAPWRDVAPFEAADDEAVAVNHVGWKRNAGLRDRVTEPRQYSAELVVPLVNALNVGNVFDVITTVYDILSGSYLTGRR